VSEHHASVVWTRRSPDFTYDSYNRAHEVRFKNGAIALRASSAPEFRGDADRINPEEAFVASLSGCHMLTFLAICARKRLTPNSYEDDAVGVLEKGPDGKLWISRAILRPRVCFASGAVVDGEVLAKIHHKAHQECFIANSVKTSVTIEPRG